MAERRPPYLRFYGDDVLGRNFVRRAMQELYRTRVLAEQAAVPVFMRRTPLVEDGESRIITHVSLDQEHIEIHVFREEFEEHEIIELEKEQPEEVEALCPPGFIVYRYSSLGGNNWKEGYILAGISDDSGQHWTLARLPEPRGQNQTYSNENAAAGGWYHLPETIGSLNEPQLHNACDVITWEGNPSNFFHDNIGIPGPEVQGNSHDINLQPWFYYQGRKVRTPFQCLGAALYSIKGKDYYYIICNDHAYADDWNTGGVDSKVYRLQVGDDPFSEWDELFTIDMTTLNNNEVTDRPLPFTTAYMGRRPEAFLTMCLPRTGKWEMACIHIDFKSETYSKIRSSVDEAPDVTLFEANLEEESNKYFGDTSFSGLHECTRHLYARGLTYISTLGGARAKFDLFIDFYYEDFMDFTNGPEVAVRGQCEGDDVYVKFEEIEMTTRVNARMDWVIYKDDEPYQRYPITQVDRFRELSASRTYAPNPDWCTFLPAIEERNFDPEFTVSWVNRFYLFLHPDMPNETIYGKRTLQEGSGGADSIATYELMRGNQRYSPQAYTFTQIGGGTSFFLNFWETAQTIPRPFFKTASGGVDSTTVTNSYKADRAIGPNFAWGGGSGTLFSARPGDLVNRVFNDLFQSQHPLNQGSFPPWKWAAGNGFGASAGENISFVGTAGNGSNSYWGSVPYPRISNVGPWFRSEFAGGLYHPHGFAAVHRPVREGGPWSYLICLPKPRTDRLGPAHNNSNLFGGQFPFPYPLGFQVGQATYRWVCQAISPLDVALTELTTPDVMWWFQNDGAAYGVWTQFSIAFEISEVVLHEGEWYTCIADHVSSFANEPGVAANWENFWERRQFDYYVGSNVGLTSEVIQQLTGERHNWINEIAII